MCTGLVPHGLPGLIYRNLWLGDSLKSTGRKIEAFLTSNAVNLINLI